MNGQTVLFSYEKLVILESRDEDIEIILIDETNPKVKVFYSGWYAPTNDELEEAIKEVLRNTGYDIEDYLEAYRSSVLYKRVKAYHED